MPRLCGAARPNRVQLIVNFVTISMEPFAVAVPAADVNAFGALYASRLEDAEGFLVCYHANVARSLQAATRLIKELIAVKRTGVSSIHFLFTFLFARVKCHTRTRRRASHAACVLLFSFTFQSDSHSPFAS
jgi:hypothetical protein